MIRILVTGGNGQLGCEIKSIAPLYPHFDFTFTDLPDFDITDKAFLNQYFERYDFDMLINCAAYTAVDKAEEDPVKTMAVNRDAVKSLAGICKEAGTASGSSGGDAFKCGPAGLRKRSDCRRRPATARESRSGSSAGRSGPASRRRAVRSAWPRRLPRR